MEGKRNPAIDCFRGFAIFLMVCADYLGGVDSVPGFLKHAPDIGFTIADAIAPCFIFAIGLTYAPSFEKRFALDKAGAYRHFLLRYLALIGIGAIFSAGGTAVAGQPSDWGVLQAIGVAGLLCLLLIRCRVWVRLAVGLALLCLYQAALDHWFTASVLSSVHGGFFGAVSWGAMLILASAIAEFRRKGLKPYGFACLGAVVLAAAAVFLVPVSKHRVSASYVLVALAISSLVFLIFDRITGRLAHAGGYFAWWGENPLSLYILHLFLLGLIMLPSDPSWYSGAPIWQALLELVVLLGLISLPAWWMHRKKIRLSL